MRNTLFVLGFAFVSTLSVAGCGDSGTVTPVKDMTVKANPDLTQPLNGCNGILMCYIDCNMNNPVQSCFDDCDAGATQHGVDLLSAYGTCIDTNCFQAIDKDSGMPYCSDATINSPACDACYNRILGTGGACRSAQTACTNDKP